MKTKIFLLLPLILLAGCKRSSGEEYARQMFRPSERWVCPICDRQAEFDDEHYEQSQKLTQEQMDAFLEEMAVQENLQKNDH